MNDEQITQSEVQVAETPQAETSPAPESAPVAPAQPAPATAANDEGKLEDDGIALDEDGELVFGDKFFDAFKEGLDHDPTEGEGAPEDGAGAKPAAREETKQAPETPTFYTAEELQEIRSIDEIDPSRFPEAMQPYLPAIRDYVLGLQRRIGVLEGMGRQQQVPPQYPNPMQPPAAPRELSHKEIAATAKKLAAERLGIKEDAIDLYDADHVAALSMATQEVAAHNRNQIAAYRGRVQDQQSLMRFTADLAAQPDFGAFDAWVTQKLAAAGMTADQLYAYAQQTGDLAGIQRTVAEMYRAWREQGAAQRGGRSPQTQTQGQSAQAVKPAAAQKVPVVETSGGAAAVKKVVDVSRIGDMDEDEMAKAFIEMGLV